MKRLIPIYISILFCSLFSCDNNSFEKPELQLDCLYAYMNDLQMMKDTSTFGLEDGTYPFESIRILDQALSDVQLGTSMAKAGELVLQYEVDNYCVNAQKATDDFLSTFQITLIAGTPAELKVFGIDRKGHIEFGADPAFGGSDAFTVESWLKYDEGFFESAIGDFIATFNNVADPYEGWMINFLGDNVRSTIGMGPQSNRVLEFGGIYPKNYGEWNHIAMVYDASLTEGQLKMYTNGKLLFSKTNDIKDGSGVLQSYQPNVVNTNMWAFMEPTDQSRCMTGYMKKFRMWSSAKNKEELESLMTSEVDGSEMDIICAWDFTEMPESIEDIPDKTGRHSAKIVGKHKWYPTNAN